MPKPPAATVRVEMVVRSAGVSPSTVSRFLIGTAVVASEKRKSVDAAIAALGFVPNPIARGLAGGRSLSAGVVAAQEARTVKAQVVRHQSGQRARMQWTAQSIPSAYDRVC
ncbi:MAG: LacI family DNA-binding transcriptional regulator [Rhodoferax sp.]|nr:LacI family DNA-binding transcriptional regulator [Rhodoferax sp.]